MDVSVRHESSHFQDACDPWRSRMRRAAECLRLLDAQRFEAEIARIDECLRQDAAWGLEAALASYDRLRQAAPLESL